MLYYIYICIYVYYYISFVTSSIDYLALIDITLSNESRYWHVHCCFFFGPLLQSKTRNRKYKNAMVRQVDFSALHCTHAAKITATLARTASVG